MTLILGKDEEIWRFNKLVLWSVDGITSEYSQTDKRLPVCGSSPECGEIKIRYFLRSEISFESKW